MRWQECLMDFIRLIYPPYCVGCNGGLVSGEKWICTDCIRQLPRTDFHLYRDNPVFHRLAGRLPLSRAAAFLRFTKGGVVQRMMHALKYHNLPGLARELGASYGAELARLPWVSDIDMIIPVPLHATRQKKRGYNQSEEFALGLSSHIAKPLRTDLVIRFKSTETQTRKNRLKRWLNVSHAFQVRDARETAGRNILLVDDIITTGSTLEACGDALVQAGCSSLSVVAIAYASG